MSEFAKIISELMKMPQNLCKTCGRCCRLSIFKGGLTYDEIKAVLNSDDESQSKGAKDFLEVFEPYATTDEAKKISGTFVNEVLSRLDKKENEITFFHCRHIDDKNLCSIHETRPNFCRQYPTIHERTLYFENCGYEVVGKENLRKINYVLNFLNEKQKTLDLMKEEAGKSISESKNNPKNI